LTPFALGGTCLSPGRPDGNCPTLFGTITTPKTSAASSRPRSRGSL
jgi:hypothetical protein